MRVLVACEFSGIVRNAFAEHGHDAWSCDLLPSEREGNHIQGDVRAVLEDGWDIMIAHPPCTYLCVSGARWWPARQQEQQEAIAFVNDLLAAPINRIAIENPVGILSKELWDPDQIIQPYQFGHPETKATCLWLYNLPTLKATKRCTELEYEQRVHRLPPSDTRWIERSRTYVGIAKAMAEQWA